jgi:hypothetical protein
MRGVCGPGRSGLVCPVSPASRRRRPSWGCENDGGIGVCTVQPYAKFSLSLECGGVKVDQFLLEEGSSSSSSSSIQKSSLKLQVSFLLIPDRLNIHILTLPKKGSSDLIVGLLRIQQLGYKLNPTRFYPQGSTETTNSSSHIVKRFESSQVV